MKKTIASLLAAIMCFSVLAAPALAADEGKLPSDLTTVEENQETSAEAATVEEPPAGEATAGEATAGEATAGETTVEEATAGEATAGEATAEDTPAGEATAGEATAGEATAGEATAEETPAEEDYGVAMISITCNAMSDAMMAGQVEIDFSGMRNGWNYVDGTYYYVRSGAPVTGWLKSGGKWYYLDPDNNGAMATGWTDVKNDSRYYMNSSGAMQTGWVYDYDDSTWYYLRSSGRLQTGWLKKGGKWYYLDPDDNGAMATGWTDVKNDSRYYMNSSGAMQTGWVYDNSTWYYLQSSGRLKTGWLKKGSVWSTKWYYLDPDNNGAMATGWTDVKNDSRYYMNSSGAMQTGWLSSGGKRYYLTPTGRMATGWLYLDSNDHYFYSADDGVSSSDLGSMAYSTEIDGRAIDSSGNAAVPTFDETLSSTEVITERAQYYDSDTSNLLLLDRSACRLYVFEGAQDNWNLKYNWACSNGKSSTPTPSGTYTVQDRGYYFDSRGSRCFYWTQFYGSYCMHSTLYYPNGSSPSTASVMNSALGYRISHGCVRLSTSNAKWVYNNIGSGTTMVIY